MSKNRKPGVYEKYIKRPMDIFCSGLALVVLSPVMGVTALLVRKNLGSPVLFSQERPGKDEKIFRLYKFRTMNDATDSEGNLLPDSERLTKFGSFLRSTSIDELPELWNILRGDMSVVGPRPLLVRYLPRYWNDIVAMLNTIISLFSGFVSNSLRIKPRTEGKAVFRLIFWRNTNISELLFVAFSFSESIVPSALIAIPFIFYCFQYKRLLF